MNVMSTLRNEWRAIRQAPFLHIAAVIVVVLLTWGAAELWDAREFALDAKQFALDAKQFALDAKQLGLCHENERLLQSRLDAVNNELNNLKQGIAMKIQANSSQLPVSFADELQELVSGGVAKIQKSNSDTLKYTFGRSGKSTGVIPLPMAPNAQQPNVPGGNPPAPKSITPLPQQLR